MSEKKLRGTFDMSVHGGKADTDLNKWPGKNEPPDDYKKSSSDYPAHGKYVDKGGYIPENEIPDPNGKNPLELLLEKEAEELGEEELNRKVLEDEAKMEARQKAEELAEMERRQNEDGNVRFRKKGGEAKSSVVNEDLEDDEFENLPKQEGMVKGAVARGVWGQKEIRGRREGVKKSKKQKNREKRKNEEQKEKRKAYGESQQELSKLFKTILKEKSDFVKENIRKLLNRKEDTQDQDQL